MSDAGHAHSTKHIWQSMAVNAVIAIAKFIAAFISGSGAMLAEAIHSFADCGNQLLLLRGVTLARLPPDEKYPLGYGRNVYFWSFMVALLLFSGGGVFSIYEGIHHWVHPEPVQSVTLALVILGFSLVLEGWATLGNVRELNRRRGTVGFVAFLRQTKDSDLVVVFGENAAAVLGLLLAVVAITVTKLTGDLRFDALGSLLVGFVLVGVAVFLAVEVKSLLVGEAADPRIKAAAEGLAVQHPSIDKVLSCVTIQQGPGEVLVALKIKIERNVNVEQLIGAINEFEDRLRERCPEVQWLYVEPDFHEGRGRETQTRVRSDHNEPSTAS